MYYWGTSYFGAGASYTLRADMDAFWEFPEGARITVQSAKRLAFSLPSVFCEVLVPEQSGGADDIIELPAMDTYPNYIVVLRNRDRSRTSMTGQQERDTPVKTDKECMIQ